MRIALAILFYSIPAFAGDWYVRTAQQGSANGTDWDNAWSLSGITWASVAAGDTIWLAGGTYSDNLGIDKSGSAGSPIYIRRVRATDATPVAAAGWSAGFDSQVIVAPAAEVPCSWSAGSGVGSYIYIDGRVDSGISFRLANLSGVGYPGAVYFGSLVEGTHDITLTNVDMTGPVPADALTYSANSYLCGLSFRGGPSGGDGIYVSNVVVSASRMHSAIDLVLLIGVSNIVFDHCKFYDAPFDVGPLECHPNVTEFAFSGNVTYRYSEFWNWYSEGIMLGASTDTDPNPYGAVYMYGNVFHDPNDGTYGARVVEARWKTQTLYFYNNTCVNFSGNAYVFGEVAGNGAWSVASQLRNNIYWNAQVSSPPDDQDYEFSSGAVAGANSISSGSTPFVNLAGGNYHILGTVSASLPRNKGAALAAAYNTDLDGLTRGSDGTWDIGAYEYSLATSITTLSGNASLSGNAQLSR